MQTDTLLIQEGMHILMDKLGLVESERFLMLIQREAFDYTKWQKKLFDGLSIHQISNDALEYCKKNNLKYDI